MTAVELTDKELRLAKANIAYALENCPVEGKIMMEDGQFSSTEMFKAYISKLQSYQSKTTTPTSQIK